MSSWIIENERRHAYQQHEKRDRNRLGIPECSHENTDYKNRELGSIKKQSAPMNLIPEEELMNDSGHYKISKKKDAL